MLPSLAMKPLNQTQRAPRTLHIQIHNQIPRVLPWVLEQMTIGLEDICILRHKVWLSSHDMLKEIQPNHIMVSHFLIFQGNMHKIAMPLHVLISVFAKEKEKST